MILLPKPPTHCGAFLDELRKCLLSRRKALEARGHLELDAGESDGYEWITVRYRGGKSPWVEVDVWDDQAAELRFSSPARKDRGKHRFKVSGLRLVGNVPAVYPTIEWTLLSAGYVPDREISAKWDAISVKPVGS